MVPRSCAVSTVEFDQSRFSHAFEKYDNIQHPVYESLAEVNEFFCVPEVMHLEHLIAQKRTLSVSRAHSARTGIVSKRLNLS